MTFTVTNAIRTVTITPRSSEVVASGSILPGRFTSASDPQFTPIVKPEFGSSSVPDIEGHTLIVPIITGDAEIE